MGLYSVDLDGYEDLSKFTISNCSSNELEEYLDILHTRLKIENLRDRTIKDYMKWYKNYALYCNDKQITKLSELNSNTIYDWLSSMNVADTTKNIRLKSLKATLNRLYDMDYIPDNFWKDIRITVDTVQKHGAREEDIQKLLLTLDLSNFFELRDAVAILMMYKTGIRNSTMMLLREKHIAFSEKILYLDGEVMKNHKKLALPIDEQLSDLTQLLIKQNNKIREHNNKNNDYIFITRVGDSLFKGGSHSNVIQKRLLKYSNRYDLENISPHALRRGFATNLLKAGANVGLISKALGHSSLEVTTQYLDITEKEVIEGIRKYME